MAYFSVNKNEVTGSEPTTLAEAQIYFRSEQSGGIEDNLILSLLKSARWQIEQFCSISLIEREVEVEIIEFEQWLPFGPVGTLTVTAGSPEILGTKHPYVKATERAVIEYTTEAKVNDDLLQAVYELAFFLYERGDFQTTVADWPPKIRRNLQPYKRLLFV
jgi:hypothetical protein